MTKAHNGKITTEGLQLPSACDICGKSRAHGSHVKSIWPQGRVE